VGVAVAAGEGNGGVAEAAQGEERGGVRRAHARGDGV
jgi:hypothetical protein